MASPAGTPAGSERFPKALRLRHRQEFLKVQERGYKVATEPLLAIALPNNLGVTRLGLTVSSKVGNAVVRARIRRLLRELFRRRHGELPRGLDLVLIARASAKEANLEGLGRAFGTIAARLSKVVR